jgi:hypothetical protein
MGVSSQRNAPAALYPGERAPGSYCLGGWVALRTGKDTEASLQRGSNPVRPVTCNGCSIKQFVWDALDWLNIHYYEKSVETLVTALNRIIT